jgi:hypothetical protein
MTNTSLDQMSTDELLDRVAVLQAQGKQVGDELTGLKAEVRRRMKVGDYADITTSTGDDVRVSMQSGGSKYQFDTNAFREGLSPEVFEQITTTTIDPDLLYEAIAAGRIPARLLEAPITTEKKGTPRVVITRAPRTTAE